MAISAGIGAAAGAVTGGITAALLDFGIGEEEAHFFAEGIRRGGTLVSLTTRMQWLEWAENIMKRYQPLSLEEHFSSRSEQQTTAFTSPQATDEQPPPATAEVSSTAPTNRARSYRTDYTI